MGTAASFNFPLGITVASDNYIYLADSSNNTIRFISTIGDVGTLAGTAGPISFADGSGTDARFYAPGGITLDPAGNAYVADTLNTSIRKINPQGVVTTVVPASKLIGNPTTIVRQQSGDIYVTASYANSIEKISTAGLTSLFAGPQSVFPDAGSGFAAPFAIPQGTISDGDGNIYVCDSFNRIIRKITPSGSISNWTGAIFFSGSTDGSLAQARFNEPYGLAIDGTGNIYVADAGNHTIRKITPAGNVTTLAGSADMWGFDDGFGPAARFNSPEALAVDQAGNVFVADTGNKTIRKITPIGQVTTLGGLPFAKGNANGSGGNARFAAPVGIAVDSAGTLYIVDQDNNSIRKGQLSPGIAAPTITAQSQSQTVFAGAAALLSVTTAADSTSTYQWYVNGVPLAGATGDTYYIASVDPLQAGNYTVVIGNNGGIAASAPITLTVDPHPAVTDQASSITNISTRSFVGGGASAQIAGFVISGSKPKQVFIRACGPALIQFGVPGLLLDPKIVLHSATSIIAENDDWGSIPTERDQILSVVNSRGLFGFAPGSKDAAIIVTLDPGNYTAVVSGNNETTGVALIEVYDLTPAATQAKVVNISTRTEVHSGAEVAIAGFIISGSAPKMVLVRASGPALAQYGVTNLLADPTITVYSGPTAIAQNDNWETPNATAVLAANQKAGAFLFSTGSKDAALVLQLQPGAYTAVVAGNNGSTGVALLEVFELQ